MFTLKCNRRKGTVENLNFSLRRAVTLSAYQGRENGEDRKQLRNSKFHEVGLEKLKLADDQLKDYEKQVKPNDEDIKETGQDEQAMETDDEKSSNSVIENESELAADKVNKGIFEGSPDGNGQSSSRNEAQVMYDTARETTNELADENMDASQNGVLSDEID
ncbi:hypothetical protein T06_14907 [Trichinella sp. T6]|nr:hypothetical protein T06_14907 [Trichinella sp. T6]